MGLTSRNLSGILRDMTTTQTTTKHYSDADLAKMVDKYHADHRLYADSRVGDARGERAYARIEKMCADLELAGQMGDFLALLRD